MKRLTSSVANLAPFPTHIIFLFEDLIEFSISSRDFVSPNSPFINSSNQTNSSNSSNKSIQLSVDFLSRGSEKI